MPSSFVRNPHDPFVIACKNFSSKEWNPLYVILDWNTVIYLQKTFAYVIAAAPK